MPLMIARFKTQKADFEELINDSRDLEMRR
jgi:hypothetical protein